MTWPRLSTFPSTNGVIAVLLVLWLATGACALSGLPVAAAWYDALKVYSGATVAQFLAKRATYKPPPTP